MKHIETKHHIQCWITPDLYQRLEAYATRRGEQQGRNVPLAELVRQGLEKLIEQENTK